MLRKMKGFTLIEVMIVVAIIMIALAIIVPNVAIIFTNNEPAGQVEIVDQDKSASSPQISAPSPNEPDEKSTTGDNKAL